MIFLLDDDKFNAVIKTYKCEFIFEERYKSLVQYFKSETDVDFELDRLTTKDIVCFHNSFPSEKTAIVERLRFFNEEKKIFQIISFSLDNSFYQTRKDENELKIHKDRFYYNLKSFIDSDFRLENLLYGDYSSKSEAKLITIRIFEMLFLYNDEQPFDIKSVLPRDVKRLCELASYNYESFIGKLDEIDTGKFRKLITQLNKNI